MDHVTTGSLASDWILEPSALCSHGGPRWGLWWCYPVEWGGEVRGGVVTGVSPCLLPFPCSHGTSGSLGGVGGEQPASPGLLGPASGLSLPKVSSKPPPGWRGGLMGNSPCRTPVPPKARCCTAGSQGPTLICLCPSHPSPPRTHSRHGFRVPWLWGQSHQPFGKCLIAAFTQNCCLPRS